MSYSPNSMTGLPLLDFNRLDALFVDLDDTIVDYRNPCIAGLAQAKRLSPEISRIDLATLEQEFRELLRENLPRLFDGELTVDSERILRMEGLLKMHGNPAEPGTVRECDSQFMDGFWSARSLMDGALEILENCSEIGLPVVVITNGNLEMQNRTLEMLGLEKYIHSMLTPGKSSQMKPGPYLFEKALAVTGAEREKAVMVGDTWQHDILGAMNSGIRPVWINRRHLPRPDADGVLEIASLRELTGEYSGDRRNVH